MESIWSEDPFFVLYRGKADNDDDVYPYHDNEIEYGDAAHIDNSVEDMTEDNLSDMDTESNPEQVHQLCLVEKVVKIIKCALNLIISSSQPILLSISSSCFLVAFC